MSGSLSSAGVRLAGPSLAAVSRAVRPRDVPPALLEQMTRTLADTAGQGLAAPQLGHAIRLFMVSARKPGGGPIVVLNPRVKRASRAREWDWEACLSVPGYGALVSRPRMVDVEYETLRGAIVSKVLSGDSARVFQHELDHLDGILYTERADMRSFIHESVMERDAEREAIEDLVVFDGERPAPPAAPESGSVEGRGDS